MPRHCLCHTMPPGVYCVHCAPYALLARAGGLPREAPASSKLAVEASGGKMRVSGAGKAEAIVEAASGYKQDVACEGCVLTLPYPPSINGYWATVGKRRVITREGRQYRTHALEQIAQQRRADCPWPLGGRLEVTLRLYPASGHASDIDNRVKVALDLLQQARVITNDNQIDALHVYRERMTTGGRVTVELKPY